MRIALIDPSLYTIPYDSALIEGLQAHGHQVRLFGRALRNADVPLGDHVDLEVVFYRNTERWRKEGGRKWLPLMKAVEHSLVFNELLRALKAFRPDIVHWQWSSVPILDVLFLKGLRRHWPQVVTVHDTNLFHRSGLARARTFGWSRFICSANQVIVHLESSRQTLVRRGVDQSRINIVRHGVFPRATQPRGSSDGTVERRLRVLFFGRIILNKGIHTLIEAVAMLPAEVRNQMELHVAGALRVPINTWRRLLDRANLGDVLKLRAEFIPEPELDEMIASSDVLVFPHLDVDASGALMKGAGYDKVMIASDIPSFIESFGESGAALFFRVADPRSLANALEQVVTNETLRRDLQGRVNRLRTGALSWFELGEQTVRVYRKAGASEGSVPCVA